MIKCNVTVCGTIGRDAATRTGKEEKTFLSFPLRVAIQSKDGQSETVEIGVSRDGGPEEAAGYRSLIQDYGLTQEEAAHRVSKSRPAVANAMRLLSLPQEVQWLIEQGNLSAGHGRALLSLPAPEEQIQFAGEIMEKGYSVRETEERIRQRLQAQDQPAQARPAPSPLRLYYKEAERQLTAGLGRRVTITQGKKKGKIALEYYDQEDLEGLMQALSALDTGKERRKP